MDNKVRRSVVVILAIVFGCLAVILAVIFPKNTSREMDVFRSQNAPESAADLSANLPYESGLFKSDEEYFISDSYFQETASYQQSVNIRLTSGVKSVDKFKTELPYICITFDDSPSGDMEGIFEVLEKYNMRATFFVNGIYIMANPGYLTQIIDKGHTIGNHTYGHLDVTQISVERYRWQINAVDEMVFEETGIHTTLFRPPFGKRKWDYLLTKYTEVMWSVASNDSFYGSETVYQNAILVEKGSIVLFHTASIDTATLEKICKYYYELGLTSIPVEEMLAKNTVEKEGLQALESMEYYIR